MVPPPPESEETVKWYDRRVLLTNVVTHDEWLCPTFRDADRLEVVLWTCGS